MSVVAVVFAILFLVMAVVGYLERNTTTTVLALIGLFLAVSRLA